MDLEEFNEKEFNRKVDVMDILSHFISSREEHCGQGDDKNISAISFLPSEYKTQLLMSVEERLEVLTTTKPRFSHPSQFRITPGVVIFQNFSPQKKYSTAITIANIDTESHFIRIVSENDAEFFIEFKGSIFNTRVAPGMSHVYNLQFSPDKAEDYYYQLKISTDLGLFNVPIIALGPRPILDFPDMITLPPTAPKISSSMPLSILNLGNAPAIFKLSSGNPHFSMRPSNGIISPCQTHQFTLNFISRTVGNFTGLIFLKYETGELVRIRVRGSTSNCKISLSTEYLKMENTFLGLSTDKTIKIFNNSDYTLHYQWMRFQSLEEDNEEQQKFAEIFTTLKKTEAHRYANLKYFDICDSEIHEKACERILQDEISILATETFPFSSKKFFLSPMSGKIWPRCSAEILVTFQAEKISETSITAFLEVSGSEKRFPLKMTGIGRGPEIKLNTTTIEIDKIYLCSTQNIEIICANAGFIPGHLLFKEKSPDFGAVIKVTPNSHELNPNEYKSFNLSFMASRLGDFIERVDFIIEESLEIIPVYIKGLSICPSLHFDKSSIDLGSTGVYSTSIGEVNLQNQSTVPVNYRISILDEIEKPALMPSAFRLSNASSNGSTSSSMSHEFVISPNEGVLEAQSSTKITLEFSPTVPRGKRQNKLRVKVDGSDGVHQVLVIFTHSKVAVFDIEPSGVNLRSCLINFPYTISFSIKNTSDVDGFCYFPRQSCSERCGMFYSLSRSGWHLKPGESKKASITLITRLIGQQPMELCLLTRGGKIQKYFPIICEGQGPLISVEPTHLDFGDVHVLESTTKRLKIINDSPIAGDFRAFLRNKTSPWRVSISTGGIPPLKSTEFDVELLMRDPGIHSDKLILEILHRPAIVVGLSAIGIGSSIILEPVIFPELHFGILLTHQENIREITIKNKGSKVQKLYFSNNPEIKNVKSPPTSSFFCIDPFTFELEPEATQQIRIIAQSEIPGDILEHWWIYNLAEGQRKREILGESVFSTTFVAPKIKVNKKLLNFFVNVGIDDESSGKVLTNYLEVNNTSGLMVHIKISTCGRFRIIGEEEVGDRMINIVIYDNETRLIGIFFQPEEQNDLLFSKSYEGRVTIEFDGGSSGINIRCKAAVNYPTITLPSKELEFDATLGASCERILIMKNEGPVPVHFNLLWDENNMRKVFIEDRRLSELSATNSQEFFEYNANEHEKLDEVREESIDELLRISKTEGIIPPNEEEMIALDFSARRPMTVQTQLICRVLGGPNEIIKIEARTDFVRYHLNTKKIDFGYQNVLNKVHESIMVNNSCEMNLHFKVDHRGTFADSNGILEIIPTEGIIPRKSTIEFEIIYQCLIPGNFEENLTIHVENLFAEAIIIRGCTVLPQIHIDLFHDWREKNYPLAKEYSALQSFNILNIVEDDISVELIRDHHRLILNNWDIIYPNEFVPTPVEIDMKIEEFFATEFIRDNRLFLLATPKFHKPRPISHLYSAEYILNMNYIIAGQLIHQLLIIYNYSPLRLSIKMKPPGKKNYLSRYGIMAKFRDQEILMPREFCKLDININPPTDIFHENTKKIKRKIYLEVANSYTIPISIIGTITSPILKLDRNILNFGDVILGNCKIMKFRIKNDGIVGCKWRIKMYSPGKTTDFPFSLSEADGIYSSGQSGVISAYFKPRRDGNFEVEVIFEVDEGREKNLKLMGRGIEQKLKIRGGNISFFPAIPGVTSEEREFSIKNVSRSPLEFGWQHLDEVEVLEERIMRVLTHYYGSKEILLPVRQLGIDLHEKIYKFYDELVEEMKSNFSTDAITSQDAASQNEENFLKFDRNSEGMEDLLHAYVNRLHTDLEFEENMKDPVSEILAESNLSLGNPTDSKLREKKYKTPNKNCIIFNGAPFTKYQETACKAAKKLGVPLLNLNSVITESIAFGESENSFKLRKIIHDKYQELLVKTEEFIEDDDLSQRRVEATPYFADDAYSLRGNVDYTILDPPDYLSSFKSIPDPEELETLDALTQYEYKIEAINLLENILERSTEMEKGKLKGKGAAKIATNLKTFQRETLADIEITLFSKILREVLLQKQYESGFVLQTLNNDFIKNHVTTFSQILDTIPPELITFINFHNSLEIYRQKVTEKKDEIAREEKEKLLLKLKDIDEMSLPEFEKLGEEDKNLFIEKVQRPRIEEARLRRKKFKEKMSKSETEEQPPLKSPSSSSQVQQLSSLSSAPDKPKKFSKKTKDTAKGKKSSGEIQINKKEEEIERTSRRDQEEKFSKDQPIAEAMDLYTKNLNTIATMIDDKSNIWLIAFSDPWDRKNYLFIIDQIGHNTSKKKFETKEIHFSSPEIEEQIFSIYGYNQIKRYFKPLSDEVPFEINNVDGNPMNSRTVLHPNGTKRFKVVFNPQKTGEFSYDFVLHIIGNNNQMHRINLSGIGDIPRLNMDPKFIFPNIKGKKTNEIHDPTFFVDTKTFDFGFLLTPKDKETKIHHKTSRFSFVNCSLINVDVQFSLTSESSKIFSLDKSSASISPGEKETLKIIASAPQLGSNTDKLFISIINNPQVEEIFLKSSGCNLDIEIDRRTINFGRILLYRKDCRRVTLRNKSPVRLFWKIMDLFNYESGINSQLSFSSSSGLIEPLNEINFNVYFDGQVVGIIDKQSIPVGFFLFKNDKEYLLIENIIILAEVYDIFLEVNGTNPIDLGIIKIGEKTSKGFSLKNRGQYNINFVIELEKLKNLPVLDKKIYSNFKEHLKIIPVAGTLVRDKLISINLEFIAKMEMKLKNYPLIKCNILDTSSNSALIAEIPVKISIATQKIDDL